MFYGVLILEARFKGECVKLPALYLEHCVSRKKIKIKREKANIFAAPEGLWGRPLNREDAGTHEKRKEEQRIRATVKYVYWIGGRKLG